MLYICKTKVKLIDTMMKISQKQSDIPVGYSVCMHEDCPMAKTCLHQLVYGQWEKMAKVVELINPAHCTKSEECPHYACCQPKRFAKGFSKFKAQMFPSQYDKFMSILICRWGRNKYFRYRKGEVLLTPEEQYMIRCTLEQCGANPDLDFDEYIEAIHWK